MARKGGRVGQVLSYTLNDLKALRDEVTRETTELGSLVATSTTLDQRTQDDWRSMRERVVTWLKDDPSWFRADSQYRAGKAVQTDLLPWYDRLRAAGAPAPATPTQPTASMPARTADLGLGLGNIADSLKWLVIGYVAYKFLSK